MVSHADRERGGSSGRRRTHVYSRIHLDDLREMLLFKLKVEELPLPRGLTVDVLDYLYRWVTS